MRDLSIDELCNLIALEVGGHATVNSTKKYLRAIYKVILSQLKLNNRIHFKGFGYWEIKERKSGQREIYDINTNQKKIINVEPRKSIFFKSSENFDISVNEGNFKFLKDVNVKTIKKKTNIAKSKQLTTADLINTANKRRG